MQPSTALRGLVFIITLVGLIEGIVYEGRSSWFVFFFGLAQMGVLYWQSEKDKRDAADAKERDKSVKTIEENTGLNYRLISKADGTSLSGYFPFGYTLLICKSGASVTHTRPGLQLVRVESFKYTYYEESNEISYAIAPDLSTGLPFSSKKGPAGFRVSGMTIGNLPRLSMEKPFNHQETGAISGLHIMVVDNNPDEPIFAFGFIADELRSS